MHGFCKIRLRGVHECFVFCVLKLEEPCIIGFPPKGGAKASQMEEPGDKLVGQALTRPC